MAYPIYNAPTPEQVDIERKRKMAELLRQQSETPLQGQMVSGHYVAPSITQGLARLLQAKNASDYETQARTQEQDFSRRAQDSMGTITKLLQDPNATDEARQSAFMAHSQQFGGRGIDTYLAAQNAAIQARNAATAAENARRKREALQNEAAQGEEFIKALMPNIKVKSNIGSEDYSVDLDDQGNPATPAQPMTVGFDDSFARAQGFDDDAISRIVMAAQKDPKLASRIALEEYKRLSKGKAEAKDVIAKDRAIAAAMGMDVGEYYKQKMNKSGQSINIHNVMPNAAAETAGKKEGMEIGEQAAMIENKYSAIDSVREARDILKQGIYSGYWGDMGKTIAKASLGAVGDRQKAARTEEFMSYVGNTVVPRLKEFGGNDSNEEMRYLQKIMGGDTSMEPEAIANILDSAERKIQRGIERLQRQRGALERGKMPDLGPGPSRGQKAEPKPTAQPKQKLSPEEQRELEELRRRFKK